MSTEIAQPTVLDPNALPPKSQRERFEELAADLPEEWMEDRAPASGSPVSLDALIMGRGERFVRGSLTFVAKSPKLKETNRFLAAANRLAAEADQPQGALIGIATLLYRVIEGDNERAATAEEIEENFEFGDMQMISADLTYYAGLKMGSGKAGNA